MLQGAPKACKQALGGAVACHFSRSLQAKMMKALHLHCAEPLVPEGDETEDASELAEIFSSAQVPFT